MKNLSTLQKKIAKFILLKLQHPLLRIVNRKKHSTA